MRYLRAFVACAGALCGTLWLARIPSVAAECPRVLLFESTNGHDYVGVFSADSVTRASFSIDTYTRSGAYALTIPRVDIDTPVNLHGSAYRSKPTLVTNPGPEPFVGARVTATLPDGTTCPARKSSIASAATLTSPARLVPPRLLVVQREVSREAAAFPTAVVPEAASRTPYACAEPFVEAHALKLWPPAYPFVPGEPHATGTVAIEITLTESGAISAASVR